MENSNSMVETLREWMEVFMRYSMRDFILYTKTNGLSMSQFGALVFINRKGASGVSDIGDELGVTSAAASQLLERLVQQGLIERSEDRHDRRVKQIVLTEKGRRILDESMQARQLWLNDLAHLLSGAEQAQVVATLRTLIEKARQLDKIPEA